MIVDTGPWSSYAGFGAGSVLANGPYFRKISDSGAITNLFLKNDNIPQRYTSNQKLTVYSTDVLLDGLYKTFSANEDRFLSAMWRDFGQAIVLDESFGDELQLVVEDDMRHLLLAHCFVHMWVE